MISKALRAAAAAAVLALLLSGCAAQIPAEKTAQPAGTAPAEPGSPVPVLNIGDPFAADLLGDGQATITVAATEISKRLLPNDPLAPQGKVQLVVMVKILLSKAGKPVDGGPQNFVFRDANQMLYRARTNNDAFPPAFVPINLTTTGQQESGRLLFDVAADRIEGGQIQLMTGQMVHAVWKV